MSGSERQQPLRSTISFITQTPRQDCYIFHSYLSLLNKKNERRFFQIHFCGFIIFNHHDSPNHFFGNLLWLVVAPLGLVLLVGSCSGW
mmetsp:Transcript_35213/g.73306  ORF Transcript_35213/g.73306 Transcript_35213/m.73306 type:complete len:88 (-) Transcript_35213:1534-1797(-)